MGGKSHKPTKPHKGGTHGKGSGAASTADSSASFFSLKWTLGGVTVAMALQFCLTSGYLGLGFGPTPAPQQRTADGGRGQSRMVPKDAPTGPPAVCPADWAGCPQIAGVDWVVLEELERSPEVAPSDEALTACHSPHSLLSPRPVRGMHLICVLPPPPHLASTVGATLAVFTKMERRLAASPSAVVLVPKSLERAADAVALLTRRLAITRPGPKYQPPALFSEMGFRLETATPIVGVPGDGGLGRLVLLEGGQWIWPPVEVGFVREMPDLVGPGVTTRIVTLSLLPLVVEAEDFLTADEAAHIVERAAPHMAKSGVALKDADRGKAAKEWRTSSQYFLPTTRDPILERVDRRVSLLTRLLISHAEYIQVLRYHHLEHYSSHHDFFDPAAYATNPQMLASVEHGAKNRLATVFFYLNNVTSDDDASKGGGATNFPRAATARFPEGGAPVRDYFDCSQGLSVYPREGKVIIFYSMHADGTMDDFSLHGGCDVLDETATKWSANFWLWNKPYHFLDAARKRSTREVAEQSL